MDTETASEMPKPEAEPRVNKKAQRLQAIDLLAAGYSTRQTAKKLGLDRGTVERWRSKQDFKQALEQRINDVVLEAQSQLRLGLAPAINTIIKAAQGDKFPTSTIRACEAILRSFGIIRELSEPLITNADYQVELGSIDITALLAEEAAA